jgi:hypothetical protein
MSVFNEGFSTKYKVCAAASIVFCLLTYWVVSAYQEKSRLVLRLEKGNSSTRVQAAFELGQLGFAGRSAISDLAYAAKDNDDQVRRAAIAAIINLSRSDAIGIFTEHLSSKDPAVRMDAAEALERIGSKRAMAAVEKAQRHSSRHYQRTKMRGVVQSIRSEYERKKEKRYKTHKRSYGY